MCHISLLYLHPTPTNSAYLLWIILCQACRAIPIPWTAVTAAQQQQVLACHQLCFQSHSYSISHTFISSLQLQQHTLKKKTKKKKQKGLRVEMTAKRLWKDYYSSLHFGYNNKYVAQAYGIFCVIIVINSLNGWNALHSNVCLSL